MTSESAAGPRSMAIPEPGPIVCPVCGTPTVEGARFCFSCGAMLDAAAIAADINTERRVVTVLFGDLSDFTAWAEDVDPERVGIVTDHVLAVLSDVVNDYGGTVDKLTGDGIMAVFGAPTAHENDPERAVRAAHEMQAAVRRLTKEGSRSDRLMGLRVGLNTGEVLAGIQASRAYTVVGDTVNTASRLSDAASVGAVYAGRATAMATMSTATWRSLEPLRLKGKREPVPAYELVGLRPPGAARLGLGEETPFIGRDTEFAQLAARLLEVVERDKPASVVVTGEAGVGKTRLVLELAQFAGGLPDVRVLWGRCSPYGESRELSALAEWMRTVFGIVEEDDTEAAIARVRRTLSRLAPRSTGRPINSSTTDRLLALLGLVEWSQVGPRDNATPGAAELLEDPTVEAVVAVLAAVAAEGPLVLVIDDAHWASGDLLGAVTRLANEVLGAVLFVTVGRAELLSASWWDRMPDASVLPVTPMDDAASGRLLAAYLSGAELDPATRELLLDRAQGNPFFLAEMLHLLVDRGLLNRDGEGWQLTGDLPRDVLPAGVQAVLTARIDGLSPAARTVLRDAAIMGNRFTAEMLRALATTPDDGTDPIADAVEELLARGIVHVIGGGTEAHPHYAFAHALIRDVAYAGVPKAERARRHARVARWAIGGLHWSTGETDAFVAAQAEQAISLAEEMDLPPRDRAWSARVVGFGALSRLGEAALARDDNTRADTLLTRALRIAGGEVSDGTQAKVLVRRAAARLSLRRIEEAEADLDKPLASRDLGTRASALVVRGEIMRRSGDDTRAAELFVSALAAASESGQDRVTAEALRQLGLLAFVAGDLRTADLRFGQALDLAERIGDRRGAGWALQHLAWSATSRGDYAEAEQRLAAASDVFAALGDDGGLSWCAGTEAFVRLLQGRLEQARDLAQGLLPFARSLSDRWGAAACLTIDALAAGELGLVTTALEEAAAAYEEFHALSNTWGESVAALAEGMALRGAGRAQEAITRLEFAAQVASRDGHVLQAAVALGYIGYCHLDLGDSLGAEEIATRALASLEGIGVRPGALVGVRVLLAQALRQRGETDRALTLLREAQVVDDASLSFPRRQALAHLAGVLLERGDVGEAVGVIQQAMAVPAEDLRSRIVALRVLGAVLSRSGDLPAARYALRQAVALAGSTEMQAELPASRRALDALPAAS